MKFQIGCCETVFVHLAVYIFFYNVNVTVEMPNLYYWKGKLSFCYA